MLKHSRLGQQSHQTISVYNTMAGVEPKSPQVQCWRTCASCNQPSLLLLCWGTGAESVHYMRYLLSVYEWACYYLSKASGWSSCSEHPWHVSLLLTEQVYIHALRTKSPFVFRFAPCSQRSLGDLFALYVGKWIRKYWQFSKCLLWISMPPPCTG